MKIKKNRKIMFMLCFLAIFISTVGIASHICIEPNYVPDKKTAIKIAEAVWLPIYGNVIYQERPFKAYLKNDKVWIVTGTLKFKKGGVAYIEIQKSDCRIIRVTHGK